MYNITYCWMDNSGRYTVIEDFIIAGTSETAVIIALKEKLPHIRILEVHEKTIKN